MKNKPAFPCRLSNSGLCKYGGNKRFNYGFVSGAASYCRLAKRFVYNILYQRDIECPLIAREATDETPSL